MSYPASKLRNVWEEVKKRSDDNVPVSLPAFLLWLDVLERS